MKEKPNHRPQPKRTMCKSNCTLTHSNSNYLSSKNLVNHYSTVFQCSVRTVIAITATIVLLTFPSIAKCDKTILNEIDNGGVEPAKNSLTELAGGQIITEKWLRQIESPYLLQMDLTVEKTGKLYIEPGVTVHVAPMVGITVRGVLNALVSMI